MANTKKETSTATEHQDQKMFKLTIAAEDSAEGRSDVFVGYNYHSYLIQRGKEVTVPEGVIEILRNTVADTTGEDKQPVKVPRYNLTIEPA